MAKKKNNHDGAHEIFKSFARAGSDSIERGELLQVMRALGQPEELESALEVIDYVKKYSFDSPAADRVSWTELKAWLDSEKPPRS